MHRYLLGLTLLLTAFGQIASASDEWIGEQVMPTDDSEAHVRGRQVSVQRIDWPAVVTAAKDDTIWIGEFSMNVKHVVRLADADAYYANLIKQRPNEAWAYVVRGCLRMKMNDNEAAIADFNEAIRLEPRSPYGYINRGMTWFDMNRYDDAIADYTRAIQLNDKIARTWQCRAAVWGMRTEYKLAKRDLDKAIKLDPVDGSAYVNRAILLASCPEAEFRNGKQAIHDAAAGCELTQWKSARAIDALAMSYAEFGDFPNAILWQQKMCSEFAGEVDEEATERLRLYQEGRPYRWTPAEKHDDQPLTRLK